MIQVCLYSYVGKGDIPGASGSIEAGGLALVLSVSYQAVSKW